MIQYQNKKGTSNQPRRIRRIRGRRRRRRTTIKPSANKKKAQCLFVCADLKAPQCQPLRLKGNMLAMPEYPKLAACDSTAFAVHMFNY